MTEQKLVNPPAFPTTPVRVDGVLDVDCYHGMTLRDYFIAHAPAEPQPWFVPNMSPKPELPNPDKELSPEDAREWRRLDEYAEQDGNERVKAFCRRQTDAYNARLAWEAEQAKQRYVQWPAVWADAMLRARAA